MKSAEIISYDVPMDAFNIVDIFREKSDKNNLWTCMSFIINNDGDFFVDYSYDEINEEDEWERREEWEKKYIVPILSRDSQ